MNIALAFLLLQTSSLALENDFVRVFKNSAPCASAGPMCAERVIVALGSIELGGQRMARGDVKVFKTGERYSPPTGGDYVEVAWKPGRPRATAPPVVIPAEKNSLLHDSENFFVFQEQLQPSDTRPRHSHSERVVIRINETRLQHWPDGQPERYSQQVPNTISFNAPVVHVVKNVGIVSLRNIVIELKP